MLLIVRLLRLPWLPMVPSSCVDSVSEAILRRSLLGWFPLCGAWVVLQTQVLATWLLDDSAAFVVCWGVLCFLNFCGTP